MVTLGIPASIASGSYMIIAFGQTANLGVQIALGILFALGVLYLARSLKLNKTQEATDKARVEAEALAKTRGERIDDLLEEVVRQERAAAHTRSELTKATAMIRDLKLADQSAVLRVLERSDEEAIRRHREILAAIQAIKPHERSTP